MSDIKPFLIPPPDDPAENHSEIFTDLGLAKFAKACSLIEPDVRLSEEDIAMYQESALSDSTRLIRYFEPKLEEYQSELERQVNSVEQIAKEAQRQSTISVEQMNILQKQHISLTEQVNEIRTISESSKKAVDKRDVKGWLAILISLVALGVEILSNRSSIIDFFKSFTA